MLPAPSPGYQLYRQSILIQETWTEQQDSNATPPAKQQAASHPNTSTPKSKLVQTLHTNFTSSLLATLTVFIFSACDRNNEPNSIHSISNKTKPNNSKTTATGISSRLNGSMIVFNSFLDIHVIELTLCFGRRMLLSILWFVRLSRVKRKRICEYILLNIFYLVCYNYTPIVLFLCQHFRDKKWWTIKASNMGIQLKLLFSESKDSLNVVVEDYDKATKKALRTMLDVMVDVSASFWHRYLTLWNLYSTYYEFHDLVNSPNEDLTIA